jgi:hypothetical protein
MDGRDGENAPPSASPLSPEVNMREQIQPAAPVHEIRFRSLFQAGRALSFPCDAQGHVDLDALSQRALGNYLYARAMVGREFATPAVLEGVPH